MPALTTVLIGEGLLPLRCADLLLGKGFDVVGVISPTEELHSWADKRGIARIGSCEAIEAFLHRQPFDLLFSIVNSRLLGPEALSIPRLGAVNYHNSLLPRYAGTNASSWAILEQEESHGVTWHLMTTRADAGDILKQARLPIEPRETAWTLDLKCYELALATFEELLSDLPGLLKDAKKQDLARRTFYSATRKPRNAGIITWRSSAEEIDRLVRALTVSPRLNPFASPLVALGEQYWIVSCLDVASVRSTRAPGTIVDHSPDGLDVATATHDVRIRALRTPDGEEVEIEALVRGLSLARGDVLPEIDRGIVASIAQDARRIAAHEEFWASRLETVTPLVLPSPPRKSENSQASIPLGQLASIESPLELVDELPSALSLLLGYLGRVAGQSCFDVGFSDKSGGEPPPWQRRFFVPYLPLQSDFETSWTVEQAEAHVRERLRQLTEAGTFARDLAGRYSRLRRTAGGPAWEMPIVVTVEAGATCAGWTPRAQLVIDLSLQRKVATWWFDPRCTPADLARGLARGYLAYSRHARTTPAVLLSDLPLVDPAEHQHVLMELNSMSPRTPPPVPEVEAADCPREACLHQLFEAQVERTPEAVAVVLHHGDHQLTYRQLNERSNQLAHALRQLGVGPNTPVAVVLDRSLEQIIAVLAILKAGGACVPLDPSWPEQRLQILIDDANPPVVLTGRPPAATLSSRDRTIVRVDEASPVFAGQPRTNPEQWNTATDLAFILSTSGSTGRPKGVALPHRAAAHIVVDCDYLPWFEKLTFLHLSMVTSDAVILEVFGSLLHGGTCVVYAERLLDLREIGRALAEHRVNCLYLSGSLFNLVIDQQPQILGGVQHLLVGGEALSVRHVRHALAILPETRLINGYGPTEGSTFTCCFPIPRSLPPELSSVPIGRPLANTQVYVLDEQRQPVPMGVAGELYISGDGVARGYWNRPELTAERFLRDPFAVDPEARMYRSGDRCRWLPDGNLEFLGRLDDLVKLRAYRVEPGEIEAVLCRHSAVLQCVVVVQEHEGVKQLVAYVVPRKERPSPAELRRYLAEQLPDYMVPSAIVILDALPLTRVGKLDRAALPAPPPRPAADSATPPTPLEADIAEVWKRVLRAAHIGLDDNFFDMGGTSLTLAEVHIRLMTDLHIAFSIVDLFQHPTVRSLARRVGHGDTDSLAHAVAQRALRQRRAFEDVRRRRQ